MINKFDLIKVTKIRFKLLFITDYIITEKLFTIRYNRKP